MIPAALRVHDARALVAVDLGAESCRVSLLRWHDGEPRITLVHRFSNGPVTAPNGSLRWDIGMIEAGVLLGLRQAGEMAPEGIRAVAADGWAVDYVRLRDGEGREPLEDPYCYRDMRTVEAESWLHERITPDRLRELTAVQLQRINTLYQLVADRMAGLEPGCGWVQLPEYILYRLGGRRVAEVTNAAHCELADVVERCWSKEIFEAAGLDLEGAPRLVAAGTDVGQVSGLLAELPAYRSTRLIAPACHDTAAAIAGIPALGDDWAYISSGTWSLVGTLIPEAIRSPSAAAFTNLAAAGGLTCFHANVNGMWPLRQCMNEWDEHPETSRWTIEALVAAAEKLPAPETLLQPDDPDLLLPGAMMSRINGHLDGCGGMQLREHPENAPEFANLIFHSLAARYKVVLDEVARLSGKRFQRVFIVGGGSRNLYLNRLIEQATGLTVFRGSPESSTLGNFAVQLAVLEGHHAPTPDLIYRYADALKDVLISAM